MYFNRAIAKEKVNANEKLMNIPQCSVHKKACSALCTNPKCKQPNRLCCINCILKDHKDDTNFMIPLDEIDNQTIDTPLPFSKASQCDSIQNLIQKIKQLGSEEQVASIFDKINLRQTQQVTQIKEYFTTKYKQTKNLRDQNLHILEEQFLKLNNLKQIKEYVSALTSQKISEEQFNQSVSQIINQDNTDEQQSAYNDILQIIQSDNFSKQILFDPAVWEEYHNKSEKLLQEYFQRCQNFRIEEFTGFKLVPIPTFKDANKLAFLTEGIEVQMGGHCAVMSSIPLKQGQYKFTLEMKQYSGGCIVFGIGTAASGRTVLPCFPRSHPAPAATLPWMPPPLLP